MENDQLQPGPDDGNEQYANDEGAEQQEEYHDQEQ